MMGLEFCKVDGAGRGAGGAAGGAAPFKDATSSLRNRFSTHVLSKFSCIDFIVASILSNLSTSENRLRSSGCALGMVLIYQKEMQLF